MFAGRFRYGYIVRRANEHCLPDSTTEIPSRNGTGQQIATKK